MAIDPQTPRKLNPQGAPEVTRRSTDFAVNYQDIVTARELLLAELIEDLGGQVTVTPELLRIVEDRLANAIAAGLAFDHLKEELKAYAGN